MRFKLPLLVLSLSAAAYGATALARPLLADAAGAHAASEDIAPGRPGQQHLRVRVVSSVGFTAGQQANMRASVEQMERILNSPAFRDSVFQFRQPDGTSAFLDNEGLSNAEVYARILRGSEIFADPEDDYEADLHLQLRNGWIWTRMDGETYGYTEPWKAPTIFTYRYAFKDLTVAGYAGHVAHEWMHSLGFEDNPNTKIRDSSVPYAIGYIVERLAKAEGAR